MRPTHQNKAQAVRRDSALGCSLWFFNQRWSECGLELSVAFSPSPVSIYGAAPLSALFPVNTRADTVGLGAAKGGWLVKPKRSIRGACPRSRREQDAHTPAMPSYDWPLQDGWVGQGPWSASALIGSLQSCRNLKLDHPQHPPERWDVPAAAMPPGCPLLHAED